MINQEEIIKVERQYYFLDYNIYSIHIPVEVYLIDNNNNNIRQFNVLELPAIPYTTYDVVVDYERSMLIFNRAVIGERVKIVYTSNGIPNLFKSFANYPYFLHQFSVSSKYKIVDGMYIFKEHFDNDYIMRISKGSFIYSGIFYTTPEKVFDLRQYANITLSGIYQGYRFLINDITIHNHVDNQRKILHEFSIITSEQYGNYQDCIRNLQDKTRTLYGNKFNLIIGDVIIFLRNNGTWEYWIEYDIQSRVIVYGL